MKEYLLYSNEADKGIRIDVFLSQKLELTRSRIRSLILDGKVFFNEKLIQKSGFKLKSGEIKVIIEKPQAITAQPENLPLDIVYQDNDIVAVNKQQGMVTHPAIGSTSKTLVNAIMYHIKDLSQINGTYRPGIVHRLDKDTSGIIIIAKNNKAHLSLSQQLAERSMKRYYKALVHGNIKDDYGRIDLPIARHKTKRKTMTVSPHGRSALTFYKVLERFVHYSLVEFELYTGRTHQIRVHAKHIHHPIVGDTVYGIKEKFILNGQLLHASKIIFQHPSTLKTMTLEAPLPDYYEKLLIKLRKIYNS